MSHGQQYKHSSFSTNIESDELRMKTIQKQQVWMNAIFLVSFCTLVVALVLTVVQFGLQLFHCDISAKKIQFLMEYYSASSVKNIAMTVGLTGILFTWLLQIIENAECSQPMSVLYDFVFRKYDCQIVVFIISMLMCIGFSSSECFTPWDLLISFFSFLAVLAGMINMWILCKIFLFSKNRRRMVAFQYLTKMIEEEASADRSSSKKMAYLEQWGKEIPSCLKENEINYVVSFFQHMGRERQLKDHAASGICYRHSHLIMRNIVRATQPHQREILPLYILSAGLSEEEYIYILSLYVISLYELFPKERREHSNWEGDLYKYIWHYLLEIPLDTIERERNKKETYRYYVYCSLVAVLYVLDRRINIAAIKQLKETYANTDPLKLNDASKYLETMKQTILFISGKEEDCQTWTTIQRYYQVLLNDLIKPM